MTAIEQFSIENYLFETPVVQRPPPRVIFCPKCGDIAIYGGEGMYSIIIKDTVHWYCTTCYELLFTEQITVEKAKII